MQWKRSVAVADGIVLPVGYAKVPQTEVEVWIEQYRKIRHRIPPRGSVHMKAGRRRHLWYVIAEVHVDPPRPLTIRGVLDSVAPVWIAAQSRSHARMVAKSLLRDGHRIIDIVEATRSKMSTVFKDLKALREDL